VALKRQERKRQTNEEKRNDKERPTATRRFEAEKETQLTWCTEGSVKRRVERRQSGGKKKTGGRR